MTYRVLMLIPAGMTFEMLTPEQQAAVNGVLGQYVTPIPSTIPFNQKQLLDGLAADTFNPDHIVTLGLPFEIIGMWSNEGVVVLPLDEVKFKQHLAEPEPLLEPHRWAGWPVLFGDV